MNIALFANPRAGGRDCRHLIDSALKFLDEHTIGVDLFISRYPGHSREQSAELDVSGVGAVAVCTLSAFLLDGPGPGRVDNILILLLLFIRDVVLLGWILPAVV